MKAKVTVKLKKGVLDPQGKAILNSGHALGFEELTDVRAGKVFEIDLNTEDKAKAEPRLKQLADKLLANTVIESFEVEILGK
ncbi:MAG TPA: phosphoribosylformylglycinamidine synthase subunit PurS [bacterium]|nr:phosphoribosylformylglycinamidine synthase subunit PurS [bacterium]